MSRPGRDLGSIRATASPTTTKPHPTTRELRRVRRAAPACFTRPSPPDEVPPPPGGDERFMAHPRCGLDAVHATVRRRGSVTMGDSGRGLGAVHAAAFRLGGASFSPDDEGVAEGGGHPRRGSGATHTATSPVRFLSPDEERAVARPRLGFGAVHATASPARLLSRPATRESWRVRRAASACSSETEKTSPAGAEPE